MTLDKLRTETQPSLPLSASLPLVGAFALVHDIDHLSRRQELDCTPESSQGTLQEPVHLPATTHANQLLQSKNRDPGQIEREEQPSPPLNARLPFVGALVRDIGHNTHRRRARGRGRQKLRCDRRAARGEVLTDKVGMLVQFVVVHVVVDKVPVRATLVVIVVRMVVDETPIVVALVAVVEVAVDAVAVIFIFGDIAVPADEVDVLAYSSSRSGRRRKGWRRRARRRECDSR